MTLPVSGPISLSAVNTELGYSSNSQISLNNATVRSLFNKPSGMIAMSDGYGKSLNFIFNDIVSSDVTYYNLKAKAIAAGWDGIVPLVATVTIQPGVVISSDNINYAAFYTGVGFPSGTALTLINHGYICGMGGRGGWMGDPYGLDSGVYYVEYGGPALWADAPISINNLGVIAGGGGGGGGTGYYLGDYNIVFQGASGGCGRSGRVNAVHIYNFFFNEPRYDMDGTFDAPGVGSGLWGPPYSGAGGQWGQPGVASSNGYPPGAAGVAVGGNSNITWLNVGQRFGPIT